MLCHDQESAKTFRTFANGLPWKDGTRAKVWEYIGRTTVRSYKIQRVEEILDRGAA
jgi:hypothetical protein